LPILVKETLRPLTPSQIVPIDRKEAAMRVITIVAGILLVSAVLGEMATAAPTVLQVPSVDLIEEQPYAANGWIPQQSITPPAVPLDLVTALEWTLSSNPDLIAIRRNLCVSAEAIEVARRLPASLNPNIGVGVSPWVFEKMPDGSHDQLDTVVSISLEQPIELGHRRSYRISAARADYSKERWNVLMAELQALVETYRLYQTAAYRREKLGVAEELADFNNRLVATLRRQMEANQVSAADVVLAEVEGQTTQQALEVARQELVVALSELSRQIGVREDCCPVELIGSLQLPIAPIAQDEEALICASLTDRPDIRAAQSQVQSSHAALCLAQADRIPVPSLGPVYERDETGVSFYGLTLNSPVPILNSGASIVRQREAEYCRDKVVLEQLQQKTVLQVKAARKQWIQVMELVARTAAIHQPIQAQTAQMERLYEAGQTDLLKLLQVRQGLIEARNTQLDVLWQATQTYADLLDAVGVEPLGDSLLPVDQSPTAPLPTAAPSPL
jgi:cobalt-zinc-cadmium efflux system outer membrane protein